MAVEFLLPYLISCSGITRRNPERRLNAIENLMSIQVRQWRPFAPIEPERDLLMAESTRDALLEWVVAGRGVPDTVARRLDAYQSKPVILGTIQPGWIRLVLA